MPSAVFSTERVTPSACIGQSSQAPFVQVGALSCIIATIVASVDVMVTLTPLSILATLRVTVPCLAQHPIALPSPAATESAITATTPHRTRIFFIIFPPVLSGLARLTVSPRRR